MKVTKSGQHISLIYSAGVLMYQSISVFLNSRSHSLCCFSHFTIMIHYLLGAVTTTMALSLMLGKDANNNIVLMRNGGAVVSFMTDVIGSDASGLLSNELGEIFYVSQDEPSPKGKQKLLKVMTKAEMDKAVAKKFQRISFISK